MFAKMTTATLTKIKCVQSLFFIIAIMPIITQLAIANDMKLKVLSSVLMRYELENGATSQVKDRERIRTIIKVNGRYQYAPDWAVNTKVRSGNKNNPGAPAITLIRFDDKHTVQGNIPVTLFADVFHNLDVNTVQESTFEGQDVGAGVGWLLTDLKILPNWHFKYQYSYVERHAAIDDFAQNGLSRFARTNFKGHDFQLRYNLSKQQFVRLRYSRTEQIVGAETGNRTRLDYLVRW